MANILTMLKNNKAFMRGMVCRISGIDKDTHGFGKYLFKSDMTFMCFSESKFSLIMPQQSEDEIRIYW